MFIGSTCKVSCKYSNIAELNPKFFFLSSVPSTPLSCVTLGKFQFYNFINSFLTLSTRLYGNKSTWQGTHQPNIIVKLVLHNQKLLNDYFVQNFNCQDLVLNFQSYFYSLCLYKFNQFRNLHCKPAEYRLSGLHNSLQTTTPHPRTTFPV